MTDPHRLAELLRSRPHGALWEKICAVLEECDSSELVAATGPVLRWPAAQRSMPDHWWAQWTSGDRRPYHALAGTRRLGLLDSVETGTVDVPVEEDWPGPHDPGPHDPGPHDPAPHDPAPHDPAPAAGPDAAAESAPASLDHGAAVVGQRGRRDFTDPKRGRSPDTNHSCAGAVS
jgi:hypothetical protein